MCDALVQVLVLDEATASIDRTTDAHLQQVLQGLDGVTMLTVAHRIDTILQCDKILVLDDGKKSEFDTPAKLLADPTSQFSLVVQEYEAEEEANKNKAQEAEVEEEGVSELPG